MKSCPRPSASVNSSSGHPQHLGVIVLTVAQKGMKELYTVARVDVRFGTVYLMYVYKPDCTVTEDG